MDTTCGLGNFFRPAWLNKYATVKCFMTVYGLLGTIQAMSFIYFTITLSTLEKRFKIPSKTLGIVISGNEISQILLAPLLSYYGGHQNRPRWIGWGVACSATSCFILALPHLIYGPGHNALALTEQYLDARLLNETSSVDNDDKLLVCSTKNEKEYLRNCEQQELEGDLTMTPLILIFLSQFILGIGNTLYYALGQTYLDDNTKKTNIPMLLGLSSALRTVGPAVGFLLGYICLSLYIDPTLDPVIDKTDPRWLGAWWLGWILLGSVMLIFAFLIAMFPKHLPKQLKKSSHRTSNDGFDKIPLTDNDCEMMEISNFSNNKLTKNEMVISQEKPKLKDFPATFKRLLNNELLMFNIYSGVFYILGASGYITYITKYIEVQYQQSAATGTIIAGPLTLLGMVFGLLASGYIISRFRPGPKYLLFWNVLVGFGYLFGEFTYIFLDCTKYNVHSFSNDSKSFELNSICNENCFCDGINYSPTCYEPLGITFYSPCHAGCKTQINNTLEYSQCSCLETVKTQFDNFSVFNIDTEILKNGPCSADCTSAYLTFVAVSAVINFLGSSGKIGNLLVNYRSVDVKDKSVAQGMALFVISAFALIPGPIIYGYIFDFTCLVWDETCDQKGNCWLYDRNYLRVILNLTAFCLTAIGVFFDFLVWRLGRNLDLYGEPKIEIEK